MLVVTSSIMTTVKRAVSLKVTDVSFFGTLSFLTTTSLSFQSSHQSGFVISVAGVKTNVVWALAIWRNQRDLSQ